MIIIYHTNLYTTNCMNNTLISFSPSFTRLISKDIPIFIPISQKSSLNTVSVSLLESTGAIQFLHIINIVIVI